MASINLPSRSSDAPALVIFLTIAIHAWALQGSMRFAVVCQLNFRFTNSPCCRLDYALCHCCCLGPGSQPQRHAFELLERMGQKPVLGVCIVD